MIYNKYDILPQRIDDLEITILSLLLSYPDKMKEIKLKDEHFIKHKNMWYFMKTFYQKFGTFDLPLMFSCTSNKNHLMEMIIEMLDIEFNSENFNLYQDRLIELREQQTNEKKVRDKIFFYSNQLINENITLTEFKEQVEQLYKLID